MTNLSTEAEPMEDPLPMPGGDLLVEWVPVEDLSEDPENVRSHSDRNISSLQSSLTRFGQQKPIVVNPDGMVIAGNGTLRAAIQMGVEKVAIVRTQLGAGDARAYAIADNRIAELADWDWEALGGQLQLMEPGQLESLGWENYEVEPLLQVSWTPPEPTGNLGDFMLPASPVKITDVQRDVFSEACEKVRDLEGDSTLSEGECLETICKVYLAGLSGDS